MKQQLQECKGIAVFLRADERAAVDDRRFDVYDSRGLYCSSDVRRNYNRRPRMAIFSFFCS